MWWRTPLKPHQCADHTRALPSCPSMFIEQSSDWQHRVLPKDRGVESIKLIADLEKYRSSRTGNRVTRTTQIDHDVFEGLPVRHWRKKPTHINILPEKDLPKTAGMTRTGYRELPLPRDFSMLPESSQVLLRAARMGLPKKTPNADEDRENEDDEPGKGDEGSSFVSHKWTLVARDNEASEPEYLAKRRKGLPSIYSGLAASTRGGGQMRKTKIRKIDAEGNKSVWEVLIPEGQNVDGEVVEDDASPTLPPAPGTVVEGLGVVNHEGVVIAGEQAAPAPTRRRPPIPKKRKHGPGRGRKKKIEPGPGENGVASTDGAIQRNGVPLEHNHQAANGFPKVRGDEFMERDDSIMRDPPQDDEEGSEEGSEGEEGEEGEREEGELSPSPDPVQSSLRITPPTARISPHVSEGFPSPTNFGGGAIVKPQNSISAAALPPDSMEVDSQESATRTLSSAVDANIATATIQSAAATTANGPETAFESHQEDIAAVSPPNGATLPPGPHAPVSEHNDVPLAMANGMIVSNPSTSPTRSSSQVTAAQESVIERHNASSPSSQGTVAAFDPLKTTTPPLDPTLPGTTASIPPVSQPPPGIEALSKGPSPPLQHPESPPFTLQTSSQFPELPTTLPQRPPTPSPQQRRQQIPHSHPSDSHRRPSGSTPNAPTPSPPTPIETSFNNPPQGLSPRAPTMSPPTPLGRDSSPEAAFPDQPRKPSPLSLPISSLKGMITRIPGLQYLSSEQQVDVEAAPKVDDPSYDAEIPHNHDPLDGLKAPEVPPDDRKLSARAKSRDSAQLPPLHQTGVQVEAAPRVDDPNLNGEIPHSHNPLDGFKAPEVPPDVRKLNAEREAEEGEEEEDVVRFDDGGEDLLGTLERSLEDAGRTKEK